MTVGIDLGYIKTIFVLTPLRCTASSFQLSQLISPGLLLGVGLLGKGDERDRRPTQDELDRIILALETNVRQQISVGRIIRFAVATAMRQDEIARVEWRDFDASGRTPSFEIGRIPERKREMTSEFLCWTYQAMTHAGSFRSKDGSQMLAKAAFFLTTDDPSEQRFVVSVGN